MESQQLETGKEWQPFELVSIAGEGEGASSNKRHVDYCRCPIKDSIERVCRAAFQTIEIGRARIYAASTKGAITRRYSAPRG